MCKTAKQIYTFISTAVMKGAVLMSAPHPPPSLRASRVPVGGMGQAHWLNDRMNRLGGATAGIGLFALALDTAQVFWLVCLFCFCQVTDGG